MTREIMWTYRKNISKILTGIEVGRCSSLGSLSLDANRTVSKRGGACDLSLKLEVQTLLLEDTLERLGSLQIDTWRPYEAKVSIGTSTTSAT